MKLSSHAVDQILHVIATFDRERGVPHDYVDLETVLRKTEFLVDTEGLLVLGVEDEQAPAPRPLDDSVEAKQVFLDAVRSWRED
jgi:hypothetical protein